MGTGDDHSRHRSAMAALARLDTDKISRDNGDTNRKVHGPGLTISTAPLPSPTATYPGPPPLYSCSSSATPSNMGAFGYLSPPSSRRTTVDDKVSAPRQSLPSIQEALGSDGTMPLSISNFPRPGSPAMRMAQQASSLGAVQSLPEAPSGPPNPFSQGSAASQNLENDQYAARPVRESNASSEQERVKPLFPSINTTEPVPTALRAVDANSPEPRSAHPILPHQYSHAPHLSHGGNSSTSSNHFPPYRSPYTYPAEPSNLPPSALPPAPDYSHFNPAFKFDDSKQSIPRSHPVQPYSDSVKHHLDIFDIEMALNEVTEGSGRALEFSRLWSQRAHQHQRIGHLPESLPSLSELDDLMRQSGRVADALARMKEAVIAQQHALAEEQARALKREHYEDDTTGFSGEFKENRGLAGFESKKRRGKAAPPGRCHSCNRAETPEWRRGPDGARTLCNACGLHYAKLTRKMAVNKNANTSGSSIRPKNAEAHSGM